MISGSVPAVTFQTSESGASSATRLRQVVSRDKTLPAGAALLIGARGVMVRNVLITISWNL